GLQVFRTLELIRSIPDKLYSGAIVTYPNNGETRQPKLMQRVLDNIRELHRLLNIQKDFHKPDDALTSYDVAHHAGLSLEEEYELLGLFHEIHRLEYLKQHLSKVLPVMTGMEALKKRIQLNGHFKELKGFNFDK
ncbi:MAG: peptidase S16, partial [Chitinophagaceae bacterium]|nr:peptidase S16 [Chitinophagaceae bacterium]